MGPEDFAYQLPDASIAQVPLEDRPSARLLDAVGDHVEHRTVRDLPSLLGPGDVLVVNDTRVLPARLRARRDTGGASEVLLLRVHDDDTIWEALVRPSRKLPEGTVIAVDDELSVEVGRDLGEGRRHVRLLCNGPVLDAINRCGEMPLPPYLTTVLADPDRYQTPVGVGGGPDRRAASHRRRAGCLPDCWSADRIPRAGGRAGHLPAGHRGRPG